MNRKHNWTKGGRMSGAISGIPVRFNPGFAFDVKVKRSNGRTRISILEPPLVPKLFDLHTLGSRTQTFRPLLLFKIGPAITQVPLEEGMLHPRHLEAVFKTSRKKRC